MDYTNDAVYYQTSSSADPAVTAAVVAVFFTFMLLIVVASYAISAFLLGRLFKKADVPQWIAWVPIYNTWKLLEMGGQQGFWAILGLIPFVGFVSLVFIYIAMFNIGKKLGKDDWFILLAIFVPVVWLIWLGFDDSKWPKAAKPVSATATTAKPATTRKTTKSK